MQNFEINHALEQRSRELLAACDEQHAQAARYANADRDYRRERAKAYLKSEERTVDGRKADADLATEHLRFEAVLQEGLLQAQLEKVRSLRAVLSALQTSANSNKEEMAFDRTAPQFQR